MQVFCTTFLSRFKNPDLINWKGHRDSKLKKNTSHFCTDFREKNYNPKVNKLIVDPTRFHWMFKMTCVMLKMRSSRLGEFSLACLALYTTKTLCVLYWMSKSVDKIFQPLPSAANWADYTMKMDFDVHHFFPYCFLVKKK